MFIGVLRESYLLLNEMAYYLLLGFGVAGILHVFISQDIIAKHLNNKGFTSVLKASLFGIPLPLCSCAVIPAAVSIKKAGAGRGAVVSFLISTPATGVDSILVTYSLLGGVFAFFRVLFSFITAIFAGMLSDVMVHTPLKEQVKEEKVCCCESQVKENVFTSIRNHIFTITNDTWKSILLGVFIGGCLAQFVHPAYVEALSDNTIASMFLMCFVSVPLYICASSSVPVAAVLIMKGLSPGAAFVLLLAGPATNTATILVVANQLGIKTLFVYIFSIIFCAIGSGIMINYMCGAFDINVIPEIQKHMGHASSILGGIGSVLLLLLISVSVFVKRKHKH